MKPVPTIEKLFEIIDKVEPSYWTEKASPWQEEIWIKKLFRNEIEHYWINVGIENTKIFKKTIRDNMKGQLELEI